ncbi:MAG: FAD-dependent oxidoreductase, partial [Oscillospiraceae bacterium]|nr:FAD-dependent oxidoreductase [Oscillospiraceae bacterium]
HNINVALDQPNALPGLAMTAAAIRRHGAVASAELNHSGKFSGADNVDKSLNRKNVRYGPSADVVYGGGQVLEMPHAMIEELIEKFGKGAALVKKAGFNMIMLHAGHGWLLQQFFSPAHNHRTDEYGGSLENRARFTLNVLDAIRAAVGPGFPIEIRMSATDYDPNGYVLEDAIEFARLVEPKVDLLHISSGAHEGTFDKTHIPAFEPRGGLVPFAEAVKKQVKKPVAAIGALDEPEMMEEIIASGKADAVVIGRGLLADPFLPKKVVLGRDEEILHCLRCFTCMGERMATGRRICAINPIIGNEYEAKFAPPATEPKKVLIAGGGPGGMQCAVTAAQRGHRVVLCEKSGSLGGALNCERGIPFKSDMLDYVRVKALEMKKAGVEVRLNTEVTPAYAEKEAPDVLVVAVGAQPIVPPIPGLDGKNVIVANDLPDRLADIGKRVVVLGGGLVGCEAAVHLADEGREVTIVEMRDDVAVDANGRYRPILLDRLSTRAKLACGMRGVLADEHGLTCEGKDGEKVLFPADTILCAVGQRPLTDVAYALRDAAPEVVTLGDCVAPARVTDAVARAYHAALDI